MEDTFYQPLQDHQLVCYGQLHTEMSDLLLSPVLGYFHHTQPQNSAQNLSLALDVGCELGQVCDRLAHFSDRVVGLDLAPEMIRLARQLNHQPNVSFEVCSADRLTSKYSGAEADLVLAAMAGHFFDGDPFYHEAERCLRPGGVVAVVGFWSRGFSSGSPNQRLIFDRFVGQQLRENKDSDAQKAAGKVMSLYRHLSLPRQPAGPIVRLHQKLELEWNREDVAGYLYANRHLLGGNKLR